MSVRTAYLPDWSLRSEEYRHRWPVERMFAWLGHQRRPLVRHAYKAANFHACYRIACIRMTVSALLRHDCYTSLHTLSEVS
jgi:transposase